MHTLLKKFFFSKDFVFTFYCHVRPSGNVLIAQIVGGFKWFDN